MSLGKRQGGLQVQLLIEQRLLLYQLWCALEHFRHIFSNIKEITEKWWDFCRGAEWATEQSKGDNDVDNRWTSLGPILPSWMAFVPKHGGDFTWPWWSPHGVDPIGGSANVFIVSCILVLVICLGRWGLCIVTLVPVLPPARNKNSFSFSSIFWPNLQILHKDCNSV